MENIRRKIRLFFVSYGRLLLYIIGIFLLIIFVLQWLNDLAIKQEAIEANTKLTKEEIEIQNEEDQTKQDQEYISKFIDYCNTYKIEEAYNMLSDECKQEKFNTIENFKKQYIDKIFNINICNYEILKENNIYRVILTQDMLITGKTNSNIEQKFKVNEILERKINII